MGREGRGTSGRGGSGLTGRGNGCRQSSAATTLQHSGETGACAELGSNIFIISSGNKARDGDLLCTTKEAMVLYIGTNYGEVTSKEFATGVMTVTNIPLLDAAIMTRHQARLLAHQLQLPAKIVNLMAQQDVIVIT